MMMKQQRTLAKKRRVDGDLERENDSEQTDEQIDRIRRNPME